MDTKVWLSGESLMNCSFCVLKLTSPDLGYSTVITVKMSMWGEITQTAHRQRGSKTGL